MSVLLLLLLGLPAEAGQAPVRQDTAPVMQVPDTVGPAPARGAAVLVGRDTLFLVHGALGAFSAEDRARAISVRLSQMLDDLRAGGDTLAAIEVDGQVLITSGERTLMAVLEEDARMEGVSREELAGRYLTAIAAQVETGSLRVRTRLLAIGLGLSLATTLVLAGLIWLLRRLFRRLETLMQALRTAGRIPAIRVQRLELLSAAAIHRLLGSLARGLEVAAWVVLLYVYLVLVLSFFPWTEQASNRILDFVGGYLGEVIRAIVGYLPDLFALLVIGIVTRYVLRFIHFLFRAVGSGTITISGFDADWSEPTYKLVRFVVLAFALVVMFPYLPGAESDAFKGVSIFVGVLFSLGSTGAVANMIAGSLLTYTRAFRIGDRVKIGETIGDVVARTLLVTRLRTVTNVDVTIPNSMVLGSQVLNYSNMARSEGIALQTTVTIGYDVPWRRVHDLLLTAARGTEGVLAEPEPYVIQTSLDDYYPSYQLHAYTANASGMRRVLSRLHERIQDVFFEAGVEITSPAYSAMRDGNATTIPPDQRPPGYQPPPWRIARVPDPEHRQSAADDR